MRHERTEGRDCVQVQKRLQAQSAQKVELARTLWHEGAADAAEAAIAAGSKLADVRRRIVEVAAVLRCVLENAVAIFEEDDGERKVEGGSGNGVSVVEWV